MGKKQTEKGAKAIGTAAKEMGDAESGASGMTSAMGSMGGSMQQLIQIFLPLSDIMEVVGEILGLFSDSLSEGFQPAIEAMIEAFMDPAIQEAFRVLGQTFADLLLSLGPLMKNIIPYIIPFVLAIAEGLQSLMAGLQDIMPQLAELARVIMPILIIVFRIFINTIIIIGNVTATIINVILWFYNHTIVPLARKLGHDLPEAKYLEWLDLIPVIPEDWGMQSKTSSGGPTPGYNENPSPGAPPGQIGPVLGYAMGGGGINITINVAGTVVTERELETTIKRVVDETARDNFLLI